MIDSLPVLPPTFGSVLAPIAASAGATALVGSGDAMTDATGNAAPPSFGETLGHFLDASDPASDRSIPSLPPRTGQDPAADGKDVPAAPTDEAQPAATAVPVWFPAIVVTPPVAAQPPIRPETTSDAVAALDAPAEGTPRSPTSRRQVAASPIASILPQVSVGIAQPAPVKDEPAEPQRPDRRETAKEAAPGTLVVPVMVAPSLPASTVDGVDAAAPASSPAPGLTTPAPVRAEPSALPQPRVVTGPSVFAFDGTIDPAIDRSVAPAPRATDIATRAPTPATATTRPIADVRADPAIVVSATPQPAGQVFAAAIATATSWRDRAGRTASRDLADSATMIAATPVAVREQAIVHAAGEAQGSALDLSKDAGLQRMVDHIEALRDGADANDTRVRLTPDALGSVDIAVRQDGDRVHVRFTAEHDATRALIADAQPRLADLAAARGVRIGETSVSGGSGQSASGDAPPSQPRPAAPVHRAPLSVATDTTITTTDQRLA